MTGDQLVVGAEGGAAGGEAEDGRRAPRSSRPTTSATTRAASSARQRDHDLHAISSADDGPDDLEVGVEHDRSASSTGSTAP